MQQGTLHFISGRLAAGKTTLARQLAADHRAVLISEDLWLSKLSDGISSFEDYLKWSRRCRSVRTAPNRPGVRITVSDTGEGICRELRGRLFEPFFTTKGATRTGLALWITDQIVRKHGGKISIRTSTDPWHHGTVFSMFLPIDGIDADTLVN
jgi:signal transduction histidine kinase